MRSRWRLVMLVFDGGSVGGAICAVGAVAVGGGAGVGVGVVAVDVGVGVVAVDVGVGVVVVSIVVVVVLDVLVFGGDGVDCFAVVQSLEGGGRE